MEAGAPLADGWPVVVSDWRPCWRWLPWQIWPAGKRAHGVSSKQWIWRQGSDGIGRHIMRPSPRGSSSAPPVLLPAPPLSSLSLVPPPVFLSSHQSLGARASSLLTAHPRAGRKFIVRVASAHLRPPQDSLLGPDVTPSGPCSLIDHGGIA